MYFIVIGECGVLEESTQGVKCVLRAGNFFGEIAVLHRVRRTATVKSLTFCNLLALEKNDFAEVETAFPSAVNDIKSAARSRIQEIMKNEQHHCSDARKSMGCKVERLLKRRESACSSAALKSPRGSRYARESVTGVSNWLNNKQKEYDDLAGPNSSHRLSFAHSTSTYNSSRTSRSTRSLRSTQSSIMGRSIRVKKPPLNVMLVTDDVSQISSPKQSLRSSMRSHPITPDSKSGSANQESNQLR